MNTNGESIFSIKFPVIVLVAKERYDPKHLTKGIITGGSDQTGPFLPMFTDESHAKVFASEMNLKNYGVLELRTETALRTILEIFYKNGLKNVAVNVTKNQGIETLNPIQELLNQLKSE